jgi:hypothetical protein
VSAVAVPRGEHSVPGTSVHSARGGSRTLPPGRLGRTGGVDVELYELHRPIARLLADDRHHGNEHAGTDEDPVVRAPWDQLGKIVEPGREAVQGQGRNDPEAGSRCLAPRMRLRQFAPSSVVICRSRPWRRGRSAHLRQAAPCPVAICRRPLERCRRRPGSAELTQRDRAVGGVSSFPSPQRSGKSAH